MALPISLPDGRSVDVYGVVDELRATHEGVRFESDVVLANAGAQLGMIRLEAHRAAEALA